MPEDQPVSTEQWERIAAQLGPECSTRLLRLVEQARSDEQPTDTPEGHPTPTRRTEPLRAPDTDTAPNWEE